MRFCRKTGKSVNAFLKYFSIILFLISLSARCEIIFAEEVVFPREILSKYDASLQAVEIGNIDMFGDRVLELKNEIYRHGLLSINSFVDDALSRSYALERDSRLDVVRSALQVSPLNVKYWLYLGLHDLLDFNLYSFWDDIVNLYYATLNNPVPLLKSIYIIFGFTALFLLSFTFFFSIAVMMKYFSSVVYDLLRIKPLLKIRLFVTPLLIFLLLALAYGIGSPLAVFFLILVLFSPYMVKRELLLSFLLGLFIITTIVANNRLSAYSQMAISPERKNLLHLVYGIATGVREVDIDFSGHSLVNSAGSLRYAFLRGDYQGTIRIANDLEKKIGEEYGVFVSMGKYYLGDVEGAISKMTDITEKRQNDPVALFNLYQLYITDYQFDKAAKIQENAWKFLEGNRPFQINPKKIGERILVPPQVPGNFFKVFMKDYGEKAYKELPFRNLWMNPLGAGGVFFIILIASIVGLKAVTYNRYLIHTCRICGDRQLGIVTFKKEDICQYCKSKSHLLKGLAGNHEKTYRIRTHKRAVRIKSLIVPGFGFLSVGSLSMFFIINLIMSLLISLFVIFCFSFPGDYSPLYAVISRLGTVITGGLLLAFYVFFLMTNELLLRRLHSRYKIDTV